MLPIIRDSAGSIACLGNPRGKFVHLLLTAVVFFSVSGLSYGHHDFGDDVGFGHLIHFGGTITGVQWAEPHVLLRITGNPDRPNSPQWLVELGSPQTLVAAGLEFDSFQPFSLISIVGYRSKGGIRPESPLIYGLYLKRNRTDLVLLNPRLRDLVESATGPKAMIVDDISAFIIEQ